MQHALLHAAAKNDARCARLEDIDRPATPPAPHQPTKPKKDDACAKDAEAVGLAVADCSPGSVAQASLFLNRAGLAYPIPSHPVPSRPIPSPLQKRLTGLKSKSRKSVERGRRVGEKRNVRGLVVHGWRGWTLNIRVSLCKTRLAKRPGGFGDADTRAILGVMQYRPGQAGGRHGGDSVERGSQGGVEGTWVGFHSWRRSRERGRLSEGIIFGIYEMQKDRLVTMQKGHLINRSLL